MFETKSLGLKKYLGRLVENYDIPSAHLRMNFPASRGSFPGVCLGRKETSPWIENGLATEPSRVMFVTRDENNTFHSNRKHRQTEIRPSD